MCIVLNIRSGTHLFGRNYERDFASGERIVVTPRRYVFRYGCGETVEEHPALIGTALMANWVPVYYEAANEYGLCMAAVGFRDHCSYAEEAEPGKLGIRSYELITYILVHCRTADEAVSLMKGITVLGGNMTNRLRTYPVRWMVSDDKGSYTAEPFEGRLWIQRNMPEVLPDGPPFISLMDGLSIYSDLSPRVRRNLLPTDLQSVFSGKGSGALGLPGDYSARSRFVRACFVKYNHHSDDPVAGMFGILTSVYVPKGCVIVDGGRPEYTRYSVCIDPDEFRLYYRTPSSCQVCVVDGKRTKLDSDEPFEFERLTSEQYLRQN